MASVDAFADRQNLRHEDSAFAGGKDAVEEVVIHNERMMSILYDFYTRAEKAAIRRLETCITAVEAGDHDRIPKTIDYILNDLDTIFFGGVLEGKVSISWGGHDDYALGGDKESLLWGYAQSERRGHCEIGLNKGFLEILGSSILLQEVWSTLLHEMCVSLIRITQRLV